MEDAGDNCTATSETIESVFIHVIGAWGSRICTCRWLTLVPSLLYLLDYFMNVSAIQAFQTWARHKGRRDNLDWDPSFTRSEWMTESCHLCSELTLYPPAFDIPGEAGGRAVYGCVVPIWKDKKSVSQLAFYDKNPCQAGEGLLHSKSLDLIRLPRALLKLHASSCTNKSSLEDASFTKDVMKIVL